MNKSSIAAMLLTTPNLTISGAIALQKEDNNMNEQLTKDNVVGNFEAALQYLIDTIKAKEGQYSTTLAQFDSLRGNDWYTQTRAQQQQQQQGE